MKTNIIQLRKQGKTYNEIKKILGCSLSTISFHCGKGQKEKSNQRYKKRVSINKLVRKVNEFKSRKLYFGVKDFAKENNFQVSDVINKFGTLTYCSLTGEPINLLSDSHYHLDHIYPVSKGGSNNIDNLAIVHETVNRMKHNLTNEELISWCIKILTYNNYLVEAPGHDTGTEACKATILTA